ncbi:hypothetical protein [Piscinibacter gummiphilus]|uniref:Outer membrane protein OmpA-like transmembrane domain-containing protein n=1 Tax=Piscinibacter gummiphilus TaxID=946333 RepID=A0ABZ0CXZ4_9BURK|nr:hypothetical protein [Piscinibacter gummiphilus]WOB09773.1 hypothetical protein RXV79_06835 [Piscinibacter gummiphilus]
MKNHIVALAAIAACALSSNVAAQTYASVAGGRGQLSVDCTGSSACDRKGDAYRFLAGRRFPGGISAEVGLVDYGNAKVSSSGATGEFAVTGVTAGIAGDLPLSSSFGFATRFGIAMLRTQLRVSAAISGSQSTDKNVAPYVGLGLYVTPWQNIRLELSVDQSRAEFRGSKGDVRAVMLGARVLF